MQPFLEKYYKEHPFIQNVVSEGDHEALISIIEKYNIKSVFEIGTWEGYTAALLMGHPQIDRVKTIDVHNEMGIEYKHSMHTLRGKEFYGEHLKGTNVEFEFCDSAKYKPKEGEQYDLVFIDGNHSYEYIQNDTRLALKFKPKVIVWHDYESSNPQVLIFVTELQKKLKSIKKCENSTAVYWEVNDDTLF